MASLADELRVLQELLDRGTITEDDFNAAKAAMLRRAAEEDHTPADAVDLELLRRRLQSELLRLDQEWSADQPSSPSDGRSSIPQPPSAFGALISAVVCLFLVGFGLFWVVKTWNVTPMPSLLRRVGHLAILAGIGVPIYHGLRYSAYLQAYQAYQRRRDEILADLHDLESEKTGWADF